MIVTLFNGKYHKNLQSIVFQILYLAYENLKSWLDTEMDARMHWGIVSMILSQKWTQSSWTWTRKYRLYYFYSYKSLYGWSYITTSSVPGCRWILQELERLIVYAKMRFTGGEGDRQISFFNLRNHSLINLIVSTKEPVKSLGKLFCHLEG